MMLPIDPDYTAGELLDHLVSWRSSGVLYGDPTVAPYHVLNYPPTFLALARGVTALGAPPLVAGRLLGSAGILCALLVLWMWLRDEGLEAWSALAITALVATSFPFVYSTGQFHLEGFASAATVAGFWLARRPGRRTPILAGILLAAACLIKQPQVVLSLVALAWVWKYRVRDRWLVLSGYVATGAVGTMLITAMFGREAWRQMITDTVGTFSLSQFGLQLTSHALPWAIFAVFAFRAAFRDAGRRRDIRCWYLVGSTLWIFSAARVGAAYPYFLDWQLAVMLWVGAALQDWTANDTATPRRFARVATVALAAQIVVADLAVAAILGYDVRAARQTTDLLPSLCPLVPAAPALTPSESPGLIRACGGRPALDPFIIADMTRRRLWDETPFVRDLDAGRYPVVIIPFDPRDGAHGVQSERWTNGVVDALSRSYATTSRIGGWRVLTPIAPHG